MAQFTVEVWKKTYTISVYQKSKSVWVAVGDHMGERLEAQGRSESTAKNRWCEATRYKGNL
jgi:hypothetical protein